MYALLSVSDRTGVVEFGAGLRRLGATIVSTRGTAALLRDAGVEAVVVEDVSGVPELMGGRVRAFHHSIFGGLLYRRGNPADEADARRHGVPRIDVLACNFRDPVEVDSIDVGGPALVRAAAKNFRSVLPVVDPGDYAEVLRALTGAGSCVGAVDPELRRALARKAFVRTAAYDRAIVRLLDR
jgi:phosphoribosylaminoimidazolecarboxamide formyltransferase/IMP cyclohydrolase